MSKTEYRPMRVADLIRMLQQYPPDDRIGILVDGYPQRIQTTRPAQPWDQQWTFYPDRCTVLLEPEPRYR